jgi:hypothetical protein
MNHRGVRTGLLTGVAAIVGSFFLMAGAAQATTTTIIDQTVAGPVGGARICADTTCQDVQGIANLHVKSALNTTSLTPPAVTTSTQPGCTANIDIQVNVTTVGITGTLDTTVEFDRTDRNGHVVPGSHTSLPVPSVAIDATAQTHSVSLCATVL